MTTKIYSRPYIWMDVSSPSSKFQSIQYFFFHSIHNCPIFLRQKFRRKNKVILFHNEGIWSSKGMKWRFQVCHLWIRFKAYFGVNSASLWSVSSSFFFSFIHDLMALDWVILFRHTLGKAMLAHIILQSMIMFFCTGWSAPLS